ncbi:MAG TPA: ATP-binding protein [Candidatus Polarisedimenticolaceae bacterium]|nr:ATP-binding protein [Candidatus Polarisedimenticolaceae bacterium]
MPDGQAARERRVLVLAPVGRDGRLAAEILVSEGIPTVPCREMEDLCAGIRRGAGAALITEEALIGEERERLAEVLGGQPPWSDFPLILLCSGGADSPAALWALERLTNVLLLERPVRVATLVGALRGALRARGRQYQIRAHLRERERTAVEFKKQADQLRRSNAELERFAYVASHDLQEPLRAVLSYTQLLFLRFRGQIGSDGQEFLGYIAAGADRMHRLINDLLSFSRVDAAPGTLAMVDAGQVVRAVLRDLGPAMEELDAEVEVGPLPALVANETQLAQVFLNLIGNALKFCGDRVPHVQVSAERQGKGWVFAVADNGIGMAEQYHERIFELFRRLHSQERYPGTGIGLAVCKKIVERYGGRIWVESELGLGSVFRFVLPDLSLERGPSVGRVQVRERQTPREDPPRQERGLALG